MTQALLGRSAAELQDWAVAQGQKPFRGRQLHDWIYAKGARSLADITVFPKTWRAALLESGIDVGRRKEVHRSGATDATTKLLLSTEDGETIETVGIPPTNASPSVCPARWVVPWPAASVPPAKGGCSVNFIPTKSLIRC